MTSLQTMRELESYFNNNVEKYIIEHSCEWLFLENDKNDKFHKTREIFFPTEKEVNEYIEEKYEKIYGPTYLVRQIPNSLEVFLEELSDGEKIVKGIFVEDRAAKFIEELKRENEYQRKHPSNVVYS